MKIEIFIQYAVYDLDRLKGVLTLPAKHDTVPPHSSGIQRTDTIIMPGAKKIITLLRHPEIIAFDG